MKSKKKMIFITLLISSYFLFFFIIDTNKQDIKFFLIERGIWNSKIYVYVQNLFISKKASLKTKDRNYENNSSKSFALNHFSENHLVYDLEAINKTANKKINY